MINDAWKNFENSGKISDYLNYRNLAVTNTHWQESEQMAVFGGLDASARGIVNNGTKHRSDGDDLKCNADWRL